MTSRYELFATTRVGKSVLVSGILTRALAYRFPVVALNFPKRDGPSTALDQRSPRADALSLSPHY